MSWLAGSRTSSSAAGPLDKWLKPRRSLSWRPSANPIDRPVPKLGGQPVWLDEPFWPVSAQFGIPMTFVGQFPLPGPEPRMSYLFLTQDELYLAATFMAEGGENALLVQPGGRIPSFVEGVAERTGPTLWRRGDQWEDRVPVELELDLGPRKRGSHNYVGGKPRMWQEWDDELDASWRFFFQLDHGDGWDGDAFALNLGGGSGYAFLSADQREGRFLWDCV
ncbi:hypothetical protein SAMN05421812_107260 [Asanoa hainanensis]|uniref:DUF1963 domain-containing protein n=1 Tax=Asanoa hainanensis TaxID=560556 RepID=A0A239N600_9ACTN|nr:hypothetical protein [Asanoa hainanensis]SNT49903.1 hypothetical protein SAMN05421812_107260 [Asanoa hainanensis]